MSALDSASMPSAREVRVWGSRLLRYFHLSRVGIFVALTIPAFSQDSKSLDRGVYARPSMYVLPHEFLIGSREQKGNSAQFWEVVSDRSNNPIYDNPQSKKVVGNLHFLEEFFISDEKDDYVRLSYEPNPDFNHLSSNARTVGWVPKSELLLSKHCFVDTINDLPVKGLIWDRALPKYSMHAALDQDRPFYQGPDSTYGTAGWRATRGDLYYVFKRVGKWLLLGTQSNSDDEKGSHASSISGWISDDCVVLWRGNLGLKPIRDDRSSKSREKNIYFRTYRDSLSALESLVSKSIGENEWGPVVAVVNNWNDRGWPRFPVIGSSSHESVFRIAVLGRFADLREELAFDSDVFNGGHAVDSKLSNANVYFLQFVDESSNHTISEMTEVLRDAKKYWPQSESDSMTYMWGAIKANWNSKSKAFMSEVKPLSSSYDSMTALFTQTEVSSVEHSAPHSFLESILYILEDMEGHPSSANVLFVFAPDEISSLAVDRSTKEEVEELMVYLDCCTHVIILNSKPTSRNKPTADFFGSLFDGVASRRLENGSPRRRLREASDSLCTGIESVDIANSASFMSLLFNELMEVPDFTKNRVAIVRRAKPRLDSLANSVVYEGGGGGRRLGDLSVAGRRRLAELHAPITIETYVVADISAGHSQRLVPQILLSKAELFAVIKRANDLLDNAETSLKAEKNLLFALDEAKVTKEAALQLTLYEASRKLFGSWGRDSLFSSVKLKSFDSPNVKERSIIENFFSELRVKEAWLSRLANKDDDQNPDIVRYHSTPYYWIDEEYLP